MVWKFIQFFLTGLDDCVSLSKSCLKCFDDGDGILYCQLKRKPSKYLCVVDRIEIFIGVVDAGERQVESLTIIVLKI